MTEMEPSVKDPGFLPAPADQLWAAGKVNPKSIMVGQSKGEDSVSILIIYNIQVVHASNKH